MGRTIAIGDIHGCYHALVALLDALNLCGDDLVIPLGDVVDRGPETRRVIDALLALSQRVNLVPILGNHEEMMLQARRTTDGAEFWRQCGGAEALASYDGSLENVPAAHWKFLEECYPFFETPTHLFFHANYQEDLAPSEQPIGLLRWESLRDHIPGPHKSGKMVVVGHTSQRDGNVFDLGYLRCLDTYCYAGGWLTAWDISRDELYQANELGELRDRDEILEMMNRCE